MGSFIFIFIFIFFRTAMGSWTMGNSWRCFCGSEKSNTEHGTRKEKRGWKDQRDWLVRFSNIYFWLVQYAMGDLTKVCEKIGDEQRGWTWHLWWQVQRTVKKKPNGQAVNESESMVSIHKLLFQLILSAFNFQINSLPFYCCWPSSKASTSHQWCGKTLKFKCLLHKKVFMLVCAGNLV